MMVDGMFVPRYAGVQRSAELENIGIDPQGFAQLYPEYNALAENAAFSRLHDREPGCA